MNETDPFLKLYVGLWGMAFIAFFGFMGYLALQNLTTLSYWAAIFIGVVVACYILGSVIMWLLEVTE